MDLTTLHPSVGRPITRAGVSLFPVYVHQGRLPRIVTGPEAGAVLTERPDAEVPTISVEGLGAAPTLLVEGEVVTGGHQHRTLDVSVLVAPGGPIDVPVSCVEAGRWGGDERFDRAATFATRHVRRAKQASTYERLERREDRRADQHEIWHAVDHELRRLHAAHPTGSLTAAEQALGRAAAAVDELVDLGPLPGQCGVVVARGGRILGSEIFGRAGLLRPHWPALVRAALLDAEPRSGTHRRPSTGSVLRYLHHVHGSPAQVRPGVGLGEEQHLRTPRVVGQALTWRHRMVHESAFVMAA